MTGHIVSPWFFYAVEIASEVEGILLVSSVCVVVALSFALVFGDEYSMLRRFLKPLFAVFVVAVVLQTAIPSEETIYKMVTANFVTYENVEKGGEAIKEVFDYVVDMVKEDDDD